MQARVRRLPHFGGYWCGNFLQPDALPDANPLLVIFYSTQRAQTPFSHLLQHAVGTVTLFYPQVTEDLPNDISRGRTTGHSLTSYPGLQKSSLRINIHRTTHSKSSMEKFLS